MEDKLHPFRQPIITATGIILGFSLNVAATWVPNAFKSRYVLEYFMAFGTMIHLPIYTIVLYRMLRMDYSRENTDAYYKKTLRLFVFGIIFFYFMIMAVMIESIGVRRLGWSGGL